MLLVLLYLGLCWSLERRECIRAERRGNIGILYLQWRKFQTKLGKLQNEPGEQKSLTENDLARLRILFWWGMSVCAQHTEWDFPVISKSTAPALTSFTRSSSCGYNHTNTITPTLKNRLPLGFGSRFQISPFGKRRWDNLSMDGQVEK